jgi:hypothetical protein
MCNPYPVAFHRKSASINCRFNYENGAALRLEMKRKLQLKGIAVNLKVVVALNGLNVNSPG